MTTPVTALLGPADIRDLAARLGIVPTKTLGQNFVHDANTVRRIVKAAALVPDDVVVEVGPGFGSLTLALLPACARVYAVEIDPALAARLPVTVAERGGPLADRLTVLNRDALGLRAEDLGDAAGAPAPGGAAAGPPQATAPAAGEAVGPPPTARVANLPYNVAVPVVLHLLATLPSLTHGLVMVQREVADRLVAGPGSRVYGAPSVKLAWYADARWAGRVPPSVFWPVPNVDSGLVAFRRREPPPGADRRAVFAVVDAAFGQRRKPLRGALAGWAGGPDRAARILTAAGVDPGARGEALTVAQFAAIAGAAGVAAPDGASVWGRG